MPPNRQTPVSSPKPPMSRLGLLVGWLVVAAIGGFLFFRKSGFTHVQDNFHDTNEANLNRNGWFIHHKNTPFWNRRTEKPGFLTLFTLKGDTWPKTGETLRVQNLLLREIRDDCFRAEVHFNDFVPGGNWQQAGLLLLEDTLFRGKSIRLSLSYNSYFGGYRKPGEILIQAIASHGKGDTNLEEFVHQPLFLVGNASDRRIARTNLKTRCVPHRKARTKISIPVLSQPGC